MEEIKSTISQNPVVIFSKTTCQFCDKAKAAIRSEGVTPFVVELNTRGDGPSLQATLAGLSGSRTVPQVFVGGNFIGGGSETANMQRDGSLRQLLEKAGAV